MQEDHGLALNFSFGHVRASEILGWLRMFWPVVFLFYVPWVQGQSESTDISSGEIASVFSTALILTDTESATLGFMAFDPGLLPQLEGEDYGSEDSLDRRRSVRVFTLPWRWDLHEEGEATEDRPWRGHIKARLVYLDVRQDILLGEQESYRNSYRDRIYGGYLENGWTYHFNEQWRLRGAAGLHLLRYQNRSGPNAGGSSDLDLEGLLFGSHASALVGQLQPQLIYVREESRVPWAFHSAYSYYLGRALHGGSPRIRPETWSWSNGFTLHWDLPEVWDRPNQLRLSARRIEVGGDVTDSLGTHNYYQFGLGWLFDTGNGWSWLDNVGISIALNVGSALSGGSLVLMYNETDSLY